MANPILRIFDSNDSINLLNIRGWLLKEWKPSVPEPKGGGVFRSSPLVNGRALAYRKLDNITDTFNLVGSGGSQNDMIGSIRRLQSLLERATEYWTSSWNNEPVIIEARGSLESQSRYAVIVDYRLSDFGNPFSMPFFDCGNSATEAILVLEHGFWQETIPGENGKCVELKSRTDYPSVKYYASGTYFPDHMLADETYSNVLSRCSAGNNSLGIGRVTNFSGSCKAGIIFEAVNIPVGSKIRRAELKLRVTYQAVDTTVLISGQSQTGGRLSTVTLTNGGSGYVTPYVTISDVTGSGGEIKATVVGGVITELTITEKGYGYTAPTLIINDINPEVGRGASGTCTVTALGVDAALFDQSNSDFLNRDRTEHTITHSFGMSASASVEIGITQIIKEIVESPYWASGDNIGIFLELKDPTQLSGIEIASYDNGINYPLLDIDWMSFEAPAGRDTTCAQEVFVSNKHTNCPVNYIYCWDASGGVFSPNMFEHDFSTLLPLFQDGAGNVVAPSAGGGGDAVYFGSCPTGALDSDYIPFCNLVFDFSSGQTGLEGVWEYYNGSWNEFETAELNYLCSNNINWEFTGVKSVVWKQPTDWTVTTINGKTGYWVRFHVHTANAATSPYQQHRDIYSALNPYIDIDAEYIPGDMPALAKVNFDSAACATRGANTLVLGLRSLSRGEDFDAYLNVTDRTNEIMQFEIEDTYLLGDMTSDPITPTGRKLLLNDFGPVAHMVTPDFSSIFSWTLRGDYAKQYIGTYHAYARCEFPNGAVGSAQLRIKSVFGDEYNACYSDIGSPSLGTFLCCIDLGQIAIVPPNTLHKNDEIGNVKIILEGYSEDDTDWDSAYVTDLILIPADEWSGNFGMPKITGTSVLEYDYGVEIDAISTPRQYRAAEVHKIDNKKLYVADWSRIASSEPVFQANSDQRLWFLQYKHQNGLVSYIENCGAVCAERSSRYILMRGSN